jgi:apolipoprotein D and lipocalin family protein
MKNHNCKILTFIVTLIILSACAMAPKGVEPISGFELDRYLGKWYEIARLDHSFERGLNRVTADYSLRDDGGLKVINRGYNPDKNEWKEAIGKAYFVETPDIGQLKVSFFGPFYGGYNILALDKASYQYALVAGPNRSYLWILARSPNLDALLVEQLVRKAQQMGFPVDDLIYVTHE